MAFDPFRADRRELMQAGKVMNNDFRLLNETNSNRLFPPRYPVSGAVFEIPYIEFQDVPIPHKQYFPELSKGAPSVAELTKKLADPISIVYPPYRPVVGSTLPLHLRA